MTITKASFGEFADDVEDFGGDLVLPVGGRYEIHPAAENGRWSVVNHKTGQVANTFIAVEDAVSYAKSCEETNE